MWLVRYPCPVDITHDYGGEFLGHKFKIILIKNEYDIKTNTDSPGNPKENAIIEILYQVIGNLAHTYNIQGTYIDADDQWMGILVTTAFTVCSTYHTTKGKSQGQLCMFPVYYMYVQGSLYLDKK